LFVARLAPRPCEPPFKNRYRNSHRIPALRKAIHPVRGIIMITGTVKWFNSTKGFGFIQPNNGDADAFFHISAVERAGMREIVEGQKISYELEQGRKSGKMSACNLQAAWSAFRPDGVRPGALSYCSTHHFFRQPVST
jgi:CspA family cold shock protein